jgi:hypothetical protein
MFSPTFRRPAALLVAATSIVLAACGAGTTTDAATPTSPEAIPPVVSSPVDMSGDDDQMASEGPTIVDPTTLRVETFDGSGQMVHPDAVVIPRGWQGRHFWFAATPYPLGNSSYENPSLFQGESAPDWQIPAGVKNPLAVPDAGGYLSDPDISMDPVKGELRLYYRQTIRDVDQVYLITSADGSKWSVPRRVVEAARYSVISPTVVREGDGSWRMWSVDARNSGCSSRAAALTLAQRRSADGVTWGTPTPVQLSIPGRVPWHWDVQYVAARSEYWALVAAYRDGGTCSESSVYLARSDDGTTWRVSPTPLLAPGAVAKLHDVVYRSTFRYFPKANVVDVWYSGARIESDGFHFAMEWARYPVDDLLAKVEQPLLAEANHGAVPRIRSPLEAAARAAFVNSFP